MLGKPGLATRMILLGVLLLISVGLLALAVLSLRDSEAQGDWRQVAPQGWLLSARTERGVIIARGLFPFTAEAQPPGPEAFLLESATGRRIPLDVQRYTVWESDLPGNESNNVVVYWTWLDGQPYFLGARNATVPRVSERGVVAVDTMAGIVLFDLKTGQVVEPIVPMTLEGRMRDEWVVDAEGRHFLWSFYSVWVPGGQETLVPFERSRARRWQPLAVRLGYLI